MSKLEDLILARAAVRSKAGPLPAEVSKALYAMLSRRFTAAEWRKAFDAALARVREAGLIEGKRLSLTERGVARVQSVLRLSAPPRAKTWAELKAKYLPRLFLAEAPAEGAKIDPAVAVLAERLGVSVGAKSSASSVINDWLARTLGVAPGQVNLSTLRAALLAKELQVPARKSLSEVARLAAATLSGAANGTGSAVTDALTLRWLFEAPHPPGAPRALLRDDAGGDAARLERIVAKVSAAMDGGKLRQFGPRNVFIASVWEALAADPEVEALGPSGFKAALAEAHRRGLLILSRADLVAAMDPRDVSASEIRHQNATYHFIQRGASA